MEEFVENLKGSIYYEPLKRLSGLDNPTLWDYETAIDLFYFKSLWDPKKGPASIAQSEQAAKLRLPCSYVFTQNKEAI